MADDGDDWATADVHLLPSSPSRYAAPRYAAGACADAPAIALSASKATSVRRALEPTVPHSARTPAAASAGSEASSIAYGESPDGASPPLPADASPRPLRANGETTGLSNVGSLRAVGGRGRDFEMGEVRTLQLGAVSVHASAPFAMAVGRPVVFADGSAAATPSRAYAVATSSSVCSDSCGSSKLATWHCALQPLLAGDVPQPLKWSAVPAPCDAPVARALARRWPAAVFVPSLAQILLHGGEDGGGEDSDNEAEVRTPDLLGFDTTLRVWSPVAVTGRAPPAGMSGHSMTVIRDAGAAGAEYVVLFGGVRGRHWLCDTFLLNPRTARWQQVRTFGKAPTQRSYHAACAVAGGSRLVVFGGSNSTDAFNDVYVLDCGSGASGAATAERWTWSQPAIRGRGEVLRLSVASNDARALASVASIHTLFLSLAVPSHAAPRPRAGAVATVISDRYIILTGGVAPLDPEAANNTPESARTVEVDASVPPLKPDRMLSMLADMAAAAQPVATTTTCNDAAGTPSPAQDSASAGGGGTGRKRRRPATENTLGEPAAAYLCNDAWVLDTAVWEWLLLLRPAADRDAAVITHGRAAIVAGGAEPALVMVCGAQGESATMARVSLPAELAE